MARFLRTWYFGPAGALGQPEEAGSPWWSGPMRVEAFFVTKHCYMLAGPPDFSSNWKSQEQGGTEVADLGYGAMESDVRASNLSTAFYKLVTSNRLLFAHISK